MKAHIDAIKALITPLGYAVHYVDVPTAPAFPYVLLWGSGGTRSGEEALCGSSDLTDRLGVTCVATTPEAALTVLNRVRGALDDKHPTVTGRFVTLRLWDSRAVQVDRDVVMPGTNRHPAYAVDIYALTSVPT